MPGIIEIIGTESLGVRGLSCVITTDTRCIVIDPGVALGYLRHGLLPHPLQVATGVRVRQRIVEVLKEATDIVLSHFHGDHIPLRQANPYQLAIRDLPLYCKDTCCWSKSPDSQPKHVKQRAADIMEFFGTDFHDAEGCTAGPLAFSKGVPHGGRKDGTASQVMMTRIDLGDRVFVHASDIQLLDAATIEQIINWKPDIVLAAGPPLYLSALSTDQRMDAWENGLRLAQNVEIVILDHHLMRDLQGPEWLTALSVEVGKKIYCAADFMQTDRRLLEAQRASLYKTNPVPQGWHEDYEKRAAHC
jgi:predicted metallo-beta-lactamase superfamily hydrolase